MLEAIRAAKRPVALTGAGISAPSGVPTFQVDWKGRPIRDFLGRAFCERDPVGFYELFLTLEKWCHAEPNAAHRALAEMNVPVITQNIDGLHQKAGSTQVLELHGNLRDMVCARCGRRVNASDVCDTLRPLYATGDHEAIREGLRDALRCPCGGRLSHDVVLYGDPVRELDAAFAWLEDADLLLVIGTSLETYPAAALPGIAQKNGVRVLVEDRDCVRALTSP